MLSRSEGGMIVVEVVRRIEKGVWSQMAHVNPEMRTGGM